MSRCGREVELARPTRKRFVGSEKLVLDDGLNTSTGKWGIQFNTPGQIKQ